MDSFREGKMEEKVENKGDRPWQEPLDDAYWEALFQQGEFAAETAPPLDREELWGGVNARALDAAGYEVGEMYARRIAPEGVEDQLERDWRTVQEAFTRGEPLEAIVAGYNRGGLLVELGELQGFVPASQLLGLAHWTDDAEKETELARRIGDRLQLKVIELDRQRNRLVFSERAVQVEKEAEELLHALKEGEVCSGRVSHLCDFGAFVDLEGIEGLIHVSELSWRRVSHPSEVLQVGDQVEVYILGVDRSRKRIALSLKRLRPDPWKLVDEKYEVGQLVEGVITNVVDFGAFACIGDELEGLIHISELAEGNFLHPRNVVKEGDVVTLRIIHIDSANHRLGLSLRQAWTPQKEGDIINPEGGIKEEG